MTSTPTLPAPNLERLLQSFLAMVRIDSPSGDEGAMRDYLIARMQELNLPFAVDAGGNLIVDVPGNQCAHESILVLSGHMDVVPPCHGIQPRVEETDGDCWITSDNTTVLGADDKAGLAPILEAVTLALAESLPRPRLRLLLTTREEVMLGGAKELSDEALDAQFAITIDHTGKQGVIIHQAPSYIEFEMICRGKSVHAGIMPEQGVNAIVFASRVIEQLHLGRIDPMTTANIGFFTGGKATNIVPDEAVIRGELRGHDKAVLEREVGHMQTVLAEVSAGMPGTSYEFKHWYDFHGYRLDENHPGLLKVAEAARMTGLTPQLIATNGGSDNNVFVHRGLPGIVLSAGYMDPHSLKERVRLSEMDLCTRFLLNIFTVFAREPF